MSHKADRATIDRFLLAFLERALPAAPTEADLEMPFLELGANSLVLMEVQRAVESRFGLRVAIPQFFQELTHTRALADYIQHHQVADAEAVSAQPAASTAISPGAGVALNGPGAAPVRRDVALGDGALEDLLIRQLESASQAIQQVVAQQLQAVTGVPVGAPSPNILAHGVTPAVPGTVQAPVARTPSEGAAPQPAVASAASIATSTPSSAVVSHRMLSPLEIRARGLTEQQSRHLEALIRRFTERTRRSKALAAQDRTALADSRAAVGFRFTTKEMLYPIVGRRAQGARIWDVDGNEYVDITMGQGVTLFGHHPAFIDQALADPENDILLLGPRPPQVGEAARLVCELTGMERATFTNTGTEAIMAAMRLARAATGRSRIVMFENAYHGHADGVMGRPVTGADGALRSVPVAPGIPQGAVDDLWLLEYGSDAALTFIRAHGHEIAAVIVEPVQSRRPDLQPRAFLQSLRQITRDAGALLVFDEMITGFRIHPGGAQAWFDVRADLATYGKVVAGGMPIGVVAGAARYMDAIDGGLWQYGDASYPMVDRTIFGGTFCQHPTAMIAALATLRHLKAQGPGLQQALNARTDRLAARLNDFFESEDVPIRVVHFGSLFRFAFSANFELLFYHLMEKGIFIWEWRNYFLSTAHDDADIDRIVGAVSESVLEMRAGGFLPARAVSAPVEVAPVPLPLSTAQRQLSVLAQIQPEGSLAYHVNALLRLRGTLEISALRSALRGLVGRHEALRTLIDGHQQRVLSPTAVPGDGALQIHELRGETDPEAAMERRLADLALRPFDLARGPLFEAHLFSCAADDARLLLRSHHTVVDGLSMNLMVQELAALYTSALCGTPLELAEPLQARDHAAWLARTDLTAQQDYWLTTLAGELAPLELPADRPTPTMRSFRGARHRIDVPSELFARLRAMARQQGCTHFMALFAVYALWLHRVCQQDDLRVGMPVAGRGFEGGERLIGYCTHLLPVRSTLRGEESFAEYLRHIRDALLAAYEHQDFPFAELIESAPLRARRGQVVETVFNLDRPGLAPPMAGLRVEWQSQPIRFTPFDLTLNLTELGEELVLECDYSLDRFEPDTIRHLIDGLLALMEAAVDQPDARVSALPVMTSAQQQRLLVDWNDTGHAFNGEPCVHRMFEAQVARTPQAPAVVSNEVHWTYRMLDAAANRIAHWLRAQGVARGAVVGVCGHRTPWLPAALLGVLKAGAAYLPLDPSNPPQRLRFMFEDSEAVALLADSALVERLAPSASLALLRLDEAQTTLADLPDTCPDLPVGPDDLAYLIYTSGSTGQPKGALIEHRGLGNYLHWAVSRYEVQSGEGAPLHASISFDGTITSVFCPLVAGCALTLLPEGGAEIDHIQKALESGREWSLIKVTPAHLELLNAMLPTEGLAGRTRFVVLGGEALLGRQVAPWREGAPATRLINEYGPTETVVGCCVHEVTDRDARGDAVPIGRPIANTRLYVLDAHLQPVPQGARGELFIGGAGVARGYHRRPELTAERFIDVARTGLAGIDGVPTGRLYRTGDLVRWLPDGNLVYLGRLDSQVKLRGFRVELGEIEHALLRQPGVREAVVAVERRSESDLRVVAWIGCAEGARPDEASLRSALAESLPVHMLPWRILVMDRLPINGSGKIDRTALVRPSTAPTQPQEAADQTESRIARIWCELLEIDQVGRDENFFEAGGHSLLVLPLRDRLQTLTGHIVSPGDVFRHPTVAAQARLVGGAAVADADGAAQRARDAGTRRRDAFRQMRERGRVRG